MENEYSDGQGREGKWGAMQLWIHAKASTHKCADKVHITLWTLYPHESVDILVEKWSTNMCTLVSTCLWINSPQTNIHILRTNSPHDCGWVGSPQLCGPIVDILSTCFSRVYGTQGSSHKLLIKITVSGQRFGLTVTLVVINWFVPIVLSTVWHYSPNMLRTFHIGIL